MPAQGDFRDPGGARFDIMDDRVFRRPSSNQSSQHPSIEGTSQPAVGGKREDDFSAGWFGSDNSDEFRKWDAVRWQGWSGYIEEVDRRNYQYLIWIDPQNGHRGWRDRVRMDHPDLEILYMGHPGWDQPVDRPERHAQKENRWEGALLESPGE